MLHHFVIPIGLAFAFACSTPASAESVAQILWARQFGTNVTEEVYSTQVDSEGNVYVGGYTRGSLGGPFQGGFYDAILAKFDADGVILWVRQFGSASDEAINAVERDHLGNIFICGNTGGDLFGPNVGAGDGFVAKLDAQGELIWGKQIGTGAPEDVFEMTVDRSGAVYIVGSTLGSFGGPNAGSSDGFLAKIDNRGEVIWVRQIGGIGIDRCYGLALDVFGSSTICGRIAVPGNPLPWHVDAYVARFDDCGDLVWFRQFGTLGNDEAVAVALDSAGNAIVTGFTEGNFAAPFAGGIDVIVMKMDPDGEMLWKRQYGTASADGGVGIVIGTEGQAYITGGTGGAFGGSHAGGLDMLVFAVDAEGWMYWAHQIGTQAQDNCRADCALDAKGRLYMGGYTYGSLFGENLGNADAVIINLQVPPPRACATDLNDDAVVNLADLLVIINNWGACSLPYPCIADVMSDGVVNVNDLLAVINAWGPCR